MLNHARLRAELSHIQDSLTRVTAGNGGRGIVYRLREVSRLDVPPKSLIWQALHADCLRIAYTAVAADGDVTEGEIDELYEYLFTVAKHYANMVDGYREFGALEDTSAARSFLEHYESDSGTFGYRCPAEKRWLGLDLCRRAAQLGEPAAIERYERMASWFTEEALHVGHIDGRDPRWRARLQEIDELRSALAAGSEVREPTGDLRAQVFMTGRRAFSAVAMASSVFDDDPFDVEAVHAHPREVFARLVERAITPASQIVSGRMLLVLGDAGAGKTHLLRAFRRYVHDGGLGLVAYAQLQSRSGEYGRYLLNHIVDSLDKPYAGPPHDRSGLYELASGLPRLVGEPLRSKIARLADDWPETQTLNQYVNGLVDELLLHPDLAPFDADLLRTMLYVLRQEPRTASRVSRYLRCEDMNAHDRHWLGDVIPRTGADDPFRMIRWLGRLAFTTQGAALVLMVDQAELAGFTEDSARSFSRAVDALNQVVDNVPSVVAVIACLEDLWLKVSTDLTKSARDRLEMDPPPERLASTRTYTEIEAIVAKRLAWLYADGGAAHRAEEPTYPIPAAGLRGLEKQRTRDVLDVCQQFQDHCAQLERIDGEWAGWQPGRKPGLGTEQDVARRLDQIAAAWNDFLHTGAHEVPVDDGDVVGLIEDAALACASENDALRVTRAMADGVLRVDLRLGDGPIATALAIGLTNRSPRGGGLGVQIDAVRKAAGKARIPVIVRTSEFPTGKVTAEKIATLLRDGGRKHQLAHAALRSLVAMRSFARLHDAADLERWRRRDRPITGQAAFAALFELEMFLATAPAQSVARTATTASSPAPTSPSVASPATPSTAHAGGAPTAAQASSVREASDAPKRQAQAGPAPPMAPAPAPVRPTPSTAAGTPISGPAAPPPMTAVAGQPAGAPQRASGTSPPVDRAAAAHDDMRGTAMLRVGMSIAFRPQPVDLSHGVMLRHTGVLGSTGSGKTTLALNLLEQLLEHGVPILLVDRKGDLAGYARTDWWQNIQDPERKRRAQALAGGTEVRLFTPGARGGRPLAFGVVPGLDGVPDHERGRMIQHAASALAAMMRLGEGSQDAARRAILAQAITVLAERNAPASLEDLLVLLESRDDDLLARAGRYDDKLFARLITDLETLRLNDGELFDRDAEQLSAEVLLGGAGQQVPLSIISTRFLGDNAKVQAWVAHLLVELSRWCMRHPRDQLQAIVMLDEADLYMPAGAAKPPSKEPLQDLLKRARSGGLGVMLATQSPGDLDYRSREQINTWFVGRVSESRSIDKLRPLFERKPSAAGKLGDLRPGQFLVLQDSTVSEIDRMPSLLVTDQVPEAEILGLAAGYRPAG
jgi:energy-coupling factor transporter ATP-binding protein EcfA2